MKNVLACLFLALVFFKPIQNVAQVQVGDTLPFWSVSYIDWPPLWGSPQWQLEAVCLRAGQHCYIFSEVGAMPPSNTSMDTLVNRFDQQFIPKLTSKYGPVPDTLDGDPRVFILWLDESNWGGYFDPGQQMPDSFIMATWNRHSSEHEIIYHASAGNFISPSLVAHEFGHLLHWGQDHSPEPPINPVKYWEEAWVDEGFSTFAALYLGENIDQHNVLSSGFFTYDPDIPLIWFSSYNQVKLFMLYMYEHYGNWDYIATLISNQLNGIEGVESTLDLLGQTDNFNDAFANWCVANFIDDSAYNNGKYWYSHYNFNPAHIAASYNTYATGIRTGSLSAYGSDYIRLNVDVPFPIDIEFEGEPNKAFRLAVIKQNTVNNATTDVVHLIPNASNHISYVDFTFGTDHNQTILVPMCVDSTVHEAQTVMYTYQVSGTLGVQDEQVISQLPLFPNPVRETLTVPWIPVKGNTMEMTMFDLTGRVVMHQQSQQSIRELDVRELRNGMYYMKLQTGNHTLTGRFIKQ